MTEYDVELEKFRRWEQETGIELDSLTKQAMHDSLYSNPNHEEAYVEAQEKGVDVQAYSIWKLGWDHHVDGWVYDDELGWQREEAGESTPESSRERGDEPDLDQDEGRQIALAEFETDADSGAEIAEESEASAEPAPLRNVDFPTGHTDDCVVAVYAARQYILDRDGATKSEIFRALVPEENHSIGPNGVAANAKGVVPSFREWWWREIVKPGLRALPDVEKSDEKEDVWYPVDVADY
ncbi:hypothetical protein SAMN04487947_0721 [Halogeometricum rufum]|uniref:Uncharacterized protein n=2 Tax=Halogeometricum rufum TaxID=553469 RepID=A0A1I6G8L2_9EURY|nr:hypothetical protein SAMN04487947_0721 [Halogeometricum rufum]